MDRTSRKDLSVRRKQTLGLDVRRRDADGRIGDERGGTLGLGAFEKISAVEGIYLSEEMRRDLEALDQQRMNESERSRFIIEKYGKP